MEILSYQANVLLSFDGIVKLCDFGQARFHNDQRGLASDASTTFESTHRFMSPELFMANHKVRPTNLSDVWAYGCVALQLLSRLKPYHTIKNDHAIPRVVMSGRSPSSKPEKPHAPRCLNDYLWNVIEWCWRPLEYRPTTPRLLDELNRLIDNNLIDVSTLTPDRMSLDFDGAMPPWPDDIVDFSGQGSSPGRKILCRGTRAETPRYHLYEYSSSDVLHSQSSEPPSTSPPKKDEIRPVSLLRRVIRERYSLQHQNIVEMVGIDTSFGIYTGLVFEFCENLSLEAYKANQLFDRTDLFRYATQILEGLQYLHTFPTPVVHGDLNPSNIMVDAQGTLKLTTFSLSQIAASIPQVEPTGPLASRIEHIRYLSPEMISNAPTPSARSDMWAYGCVVFWLFANLVPYHEIEREQDVEMQIQTGILPNDAQLLREEGEVNRRFRQNSRREWLFNGISDRAEACWSSSGWPSATEFLNFIRELSGEMDEFEETSTWMSGASNLSGTIIRPSILWAHGGSTSGSWRYPNASRLNPEKQITSVNMNWTKASFKRGFFRSQTEVIIKFSMSGQSNTGSSHHIASRSAIKHETAILAQLKHRSICKLWGYEEDTFGSSSLPAIVLEFCANGTLRETYPQDYAW
ncbi:CBL-interacting protein kinase 23 [Rhizoctonia solani AG-1 IB]|uniref:CBL-interacting protein kinase 23 n=1 Tax=Thanatephorus cucumeris (strain AG1-IB / isolate 7/3/14) TaxID=1108050 RepID=M5BYS8_THACB|nr:CBL-interacting protein kinase 23 [Rhizoctonia solani AG-1 IB]